MTVDLEATLDPAKGEIRGRETVVWTNTTVAPAAFIPFHLYMNAFSGPDTVFMRETGGKHRMFGMDLSNSENFGGCTVTKIAVNGTDRTASFNTLSKLKDPERFGLYWPDEVSTYKGPDDTIGVLELGAPVPPGTSVEIRISFITRMPKIFSRTGHYKAFYMAGQWFPKIAVFEGAKGWNCHLFHADSEFFSDFANYTLTVDVPKAYTVGATGARIGEEVKAGRRRVHFKADRVGDAAFTAWDKFQIARDRWKNVDLILLHPPGNASLAPREFAAMKAALTECAAITGFDYPYPCLTLVDVPDGAGGAGGMEYPTLVTGWTVSPFTPKMFRWPEIVIAHEVCHQYFYGILASNEFEHPWMDEGMTSYMEVRTAGRAGWDLLKWGSFRLAGIGEHRAAIALDEGRERPGKASWEFTGNDAYGLLVYSRSAVWFQTLENRIGAEAMRRVFTAYAAKWKFRHPAPEDFFAVLKDVAGPDAEDFLRRGLETGQKLDFAVRSAVCEKNDSEKSPAEADKKKPAKGKEKLAPSWRVRVVLENRGEFELPVDLLCVMKDGSQRRFTWDGRDDWKAFEFDSPSPLSAAIADPDGVYACDQDLSNNAVVLQTKTDGLLARLGAAIAFLAELLLSHLSLLV